MWVQGLCLRMYVLHSPILPRHPLEETLEEEQPLESSDEGKEAPAKPGRASPSSGPTEKKRSSSASLPESESDVEKKKRKKARYVCTLYQLTAGAPEAYKLFLSDIADVVKSRLYV